MKKKYNPFKMWGSYVGYVILVSLAIWTLTGTFLQRAYTFQDFTLALKYPYIISIFVLYGSIGFLIGWAINSLWRKYK